MLEFSCNNSEEDQDDSTLLAQCRRAFHNRLKFVELQTICGSVVLSLTAVSSDNTPGVRVLALEVGSEHSQRFCGIRPQRQRLRNR